MPPSALGGTTSGARRTWTVSAGVLLFVAGAAFLWSTHAKSRSAGEDSGIEALLAAGESAERSDELAEAGRIYRVSVERFPADARAWAHQGEYLRFYAHDYERARVSFCRALEQPGVGDFTRAFCLRGLGEVARHEGRFDEALDLFNRSLKALPLAETHRSMAHMLGTNGDLPSAAEHARKAAELDPQDPIALLLYATALQRAARQQEGRQAFESALKLAGVGLDGSHEQPVHCCVLYNAAGYYGVRGDREGALKMLEAFFKTPNHRHLTREDVLNDPDFATIKVEPSFQSLLNKHLPEASIPFSSNKPTR